MLTWLQTAVEVEDDHDEAAQTQGENQPNDFGFPHPECSGATREPSRLLPGFLRERSCFLLERRCLLYHRYEHRCGSLTFAAPPLPVHAWTSSLRWWRYGQEPLSVTGTCLRSERLEPAAPTRCSLGRGHRSAGGRRVGVVSLVNPFLPKHTRFNREFRSDPSK